MNFRQYSVPEGAETVSIISAHPDNILAQA